MEAKKERLSPLERQQKATRFAREACGCRACWDGDNPGRKPRACLASAILIAVALDGLADNVDAVAFAVDQK